MRNAFVPIGPAPIPAQNSLFKSSALVDNSSMYFDLNVPVSFISPRVQTQGSGQSSKKGKGKQSTNAPLGAEQQDAMYTPAQIAKMEARLDLLVRCA